jgi:hypothetical protein
VDRHHFDANLDLNSTFHFDAIRVQIIILPQVLHMLEKSKEKFDFNSQQR